MNPLVSVIILNWNGWKDTLECLESLYQINYPNYNVILVDNHSQDQSLEKIREYCQGQIPLETKFVKYQENNKPIKIRELTNQQTGKAEQEITGYKKGKEITEPGKNEFSKKDNSKPVLTLLKNDANYGFAPGNNIAINYTLKAYNPDYIFLLNNDTVVDPNFLDKLVDSSQNDPEIAVAGPLIYYYDFKGRTDVVANLGGKINLSKYPGYYDLSDDNSVDDFSEDLIECDWISGAGLLLKVKNSPVKHLNEKLFFGCEDIDLALNLKEYGYKSVLVKDAFLWHKEGVSRRKRSSEGIKRALMEIRSNLTFLKAHQNHFYLYLPVYLIQIFILYIRVIIGRD
ncbi:MAG: glycosyltransferase family 2 protein [Methanobacterium sp.]|nr:glycosyltransferase family 2 protein [Methanobacterium sp.]